MRTKTLQPKNKDLKEALDHATDLLCAWIRTTSYPPPDINMSFVLMEKDEKIEIHYDVPSLFLTDEELESFNGMKPKLESHHNIILAKMCLTSVRGHLEILQLGTGGTRFKIILKLDDPFEKLRQNELELWGLLHPWQALKFTWRENKKGV